MLFGRALSCGLARRASKTRRRMLTEPPRSRTGRPGFIFIEINYLTNFSAKAECRRVARAGFGILNRVRGHSARGGGRSAPWPAQLSRRAPGHARDVKAVAAVGTVQCAMARVVPLKLVETKNARSRDRARWLVLDWPQ